MALADIRAENREWERQAKILFGYQRGGIDAEKSKDHDKAIECYRQAIEYGRSASKMSINNFYYSYERLAILYRKRKDYDSEIQYIRQALTEDLNNEADRQWLKDRLQKALILKSRQQ